MKCSACGVGPIASELTIAGSRLPMPPLEPGKLAYTVNPSLLAALISFAIVFMRRSKKKAFSQSSKAEVATLVSFAGSLAGAASTTRLKRRGRSY